MSEYYRQLPKAELHVHLEGSLTAEVLAELDPSITAAEVREKYRFSDFAGFLQAYIWATRPLQRPEDYALATRRLCESLAFHTVRYAEITLSAGMVLWKGQNLGEAYAAVREASLGQREVEVHWVLDVVRQFGADAARPVLEFAASQVRNGVVAFGIGGDEVRGPVEQFAGLFAEASAAGLHLTPHAGETDGPRSIWNALEAGAERIGHGFRAIEDPALVSHLRDHAIPLEICIGSNLATGVVAAVEQHPVRKLYEAGVPITLATDDPALFGTTISNEYCIAKKRLGFSKEELDAMAAKSFDYAFARR